MPMRSWIHSVKPLGDFKTAATQSGADPSPLPPLLEALSDSSGKEDGPLARALALLFEPSPVLYRTLVPAVATHIQSTPPVLSYYALIDVSLEVISSWSDAQKAEFIAGHPRIGEVKGLSQLSAQEQAAKATPPEVLARLAHLNACYEHRYPGLIYITFVNGRSRAEIKDEMEDVLGLEHSLSPDEPPVESMQSEEIGSDEWKKELERAVVDVGQIAKSRLKNLGIDSGTVHSRT
ncbi:OHCU decarboxylase-domain-containing protein [Cubamyces lactineus]|nr:OHCU decarboxylase-domain-containing protein [Cubamyces lactineus]